MIIDIIIYTAQGRGGLENVLSTMDKEFVKCGYTVRFFLYTLPIHQEWSDGLSQLYICQPESHQENSVTPELFAEHYRNKVDELGFPDVVLATFNPIISYIARLAYQDVHKNLQPLILSWIHGPPEAYNSTGKELNYADGNLAISESVGHKIQLSNYDKVPTFFIGNPVTPVQQNINQTKKDSLDIIFVGRLDNSVKRIDLLLQATSRLVGNWTLNIYGEGSIQPQLEKLCKQLRIDDKVKWHGWHEDPWQQIHSASLLVLPSDSEGFGLVLVEALQRGIPVLATATDGAKEIVIDEYNGWLVPVGSSDHLFIKLQQIINNEVIIPLPQDCSQSSEFYKVKQVTERFIFAIKTMLSYKKSKQLPVIEQLSEEDISMSYDIVQQLCEKKEWEQAEDLALLAYQSNPSNLDAIMGLATLYEAKQQYSSAFTLYKQASIVAESIEQQMMLTHKCNQLRMKTAK